MNTLMKLTHTKLTQEIASVPHICEQRSSKLYISNALINMTPMKLKQELIAVFENEDRFFFVVNIVPVTVFNYVNVFHFASKYLCVSSN